MKKSLFIVAAVSAMVLTGCSKSETIATEFDQPKAISFDLFQHKATKTDVSETNITALASQTVKISCYTTDATTNYYKANFYTQQTLSSSGDPAQWQTGTIYYWPQTTYSSPVTEKLNFFAANTTITDPVSPSTSAAVVGPTISYTGAQTDIVAACAKDQVYVANTDVALTFNHILSQIEFQAKGKDEGFTYNITSISIGAGLKNTQTYTIGTGWTGEATGAVSYSYSSLDVTPNPYNTAKQIGDKFVALPQTTNNQTITVAYSVTDANSKVVFDGTKSTTTNVVWEIGKKYTYVLTLPSDAKKITYTVSVDNWTDDSPASTNISF